MGVPGQMSPRVRSMPHHTVARAFSHHGPAVSGESVHSLECQPAENVLIYQPPSQVARAPSADLQPREIARAPRDSALGHRAAPSTSRNASPLFREDADRTCTTLHAFPLVRNPSHDAVVYGENAQGMEVPRNLTFESLVSPRFNSYPLLGQKLNLPPRRKMKDVTPSIQDATPSRPASVFWQPPPEAEVICETQKSPSFLLYAKAEDRKVAAGEREETNASEATEYGGVRWGPSRIRLALHRLRQ